VWRNHLEGTRPPRGLRHRAAHRSGGASTFAQEVLIPVAVGDPASFLLAAGAGQAPQSNGSWAASPNRALMVAIFGLRRDLSPSPGVGAAMHAGVARAKLPEYRTTS